MDLSRLKPSKGATKRRKRIGRGQGSGYGGTATRGHKGNQSRSGYKRKIGFEGGQMPLIRRIPKFGFKNKNRVEYKPINLWLLEKIAAEKNVDKIDLNVLIDAGVISKNHKVKILGDGKLTKKLEVSAHAFSKSAVEAIKANNGKVIVIK